MKGIERIHITGGEPTIHPEFEFLSSRFREVFDCKLLTLETNALWLKKHVDTVIKYYDKVYISVYTPETYEGCPDNRKIISWFQDYCAKKNSTVEIITGIVDHIPLTKRGNKICHRGLSETVQYTAGLLYPCCTGSGISGAMGIPLTDNWREEIEKVHIPCDVCWFAEE